MISLKDVAEDAGVSIVTAHRAIQNNGYVAEATRRVVLRSARRLGYRPNLSARALRTGKTLEVTAVISAMTLDELHMAKMAAFETALRREGYTVQILFAPPPGPGDPTDPGVVNRILNRRPDGAALFPQTGVPLAETVREFEESGIPCVLLDPWERTEGSAKLDADCILIDRHQGVREAVTHLAEKGRRRIAFLGAGLGGAWTRLPAYESALESLGLSPILLSREYSMDEFASGQSGAMQLLALSPRPDGVVAFSDVTAMGFLAGLERSGVRVPEDVSLVGFDDRRFASYSSPPLTTVAHPGAAVGEAAAELLLAKIEGKEEPPEGWSRTLPTKLVVRRST